MKEPKVGDIVLLKKDLKPYFNKYIKKETYENNKEHYDELIANYQSTIAGKKVLIVEILHGSELYSDIPIPTPKIYKISLLNRKKYLIWDWIALCFIEDISEKISKILEL